MSVTVVIPALNEEKYLGDVLNPLLGISEVSQIIVVSDGSTDKTVAVAQAYGVEVMALSENIGKGGAMTVGLKKAQEEVVLFLDADLIGLSQQHVQQLIYPVLKGEADMTIGIFEGGRLATDMAQIIAPFLSGQRCLKKKWAMQIRNLGTSGFGAEATLTQFAADHNLVVQEVTLGDMSHVMKEEKLGLVRGFASRIKMYWEIAKNVRIGG